MFCLFFFMCLVSWVWFCCLWKVLVIWDGVDVWFFKMIFYMMVLCVRRFIIGRLICVVIGVVMVCLKWWFVLWIVRLVILYFLVVCGWLWCGCCFMILVWCWCLMLIWLFVLYLCLFVYICMCSVWVVVICCRCLLDWILVLVGIVRFVSVCCFVICVYILRNCLVWLWWWFIRWWLVCGDCCLIIVMVKESCLRLIVVMFMVCCVILWSVFGLNIISFWLW